MSMKQHTLAMSADQTFENYRKPIRRDEFFKAMEAIVPWSALCEVIDPNCLIRRLAEARRDRGNDSHRAQSLGRCRRRCYSARDGGREAS